MYTVEVCTMKKCIVSNQHLHASFIMKGICSVSLNFGVTHYP